MGQAKFLTNFSDFIFLSFSKHNRDPSKYLRSRRSLRASVESKRKRWRNTEHTGVSGCGPGLWLRWQKNRYDVFMRTARVCQADGIAIAARRISEEKHEIVASRSRRDRTCFLSPFFASFVCPGYSRFFPSPSFHPHSPTLVAIKSDLTSIYLRTYPVRERRPFSSSFFATSACIEGNVVAHEFHL